MSGVGAFNFGGTPPPQTPQAPQALPQQAPPQPVAPPAKRGAFNFSRVQAQEGGWEKRLGKSFDWARKHPGEAFEAVLGAPQRGLEAVETGKNPLEAIEHPAEQRDLEQGVLNKIGESKLEAPGGILDASSRDLPHKLGRFVARGAVDLVNDPLNVLPVGRIAEGIGKAVPAIGKGVEAGTDLFKGTKLGRVFDAETKLVHATKPAKATMLSLFKDAKQNEKRDIDSVTKIIADHADTIRQTGVPPPALTQKAFGVDRTYGADLTNAHTPHEMLDAITQARKAQTQGIYVEALKKNGLLKTDYRGTSAESPYAIDSSDPDYVEKLGQAQEAAKAYGLHKAASNAIFEGLRKLTTIGNKAFLAVPFPHMLNISDLIYNRYGLPTTLAGMRYAAQIASGKITPLLVKEVKELKSMGGMSDYGHIYNEIGVDKLLGSEKLAGAYNRGMKPLQQLSNYLQDKGLNSLEMGMRVAALQAERRAGVTGYEAMRNIHRALGTDIPNELTRFGQDVGAPFAQFHVQTALGSGLRTLGTNPARVNNIVKGNLEYNENVNPAGPNYEVAVPAAKVAVAESDPIKYLESVGGPLGALASNYSVATLAEKAKYSQLLSELLGRYVPAADVLKTIAGIVAHSKGSAGEQAINDVLPNLLGGYYQKRQGG